MRPSIISGKPVRSLTGRASTAASTIALGVLPVAYSSYPSRRKPRAKALSPVLSLTDSRALGKSLLHQTDRLRKYSMLGFVDPLAQGFRCIALHHLNRFLDEDWARVQVRRDHVHSGAGSLDPGTQRLLDCIHAAAKLRQQRWMNVDDPVSERFDERLRMDAVVARIDDQLHPLAFEEVAHGRVAVVGRSEVLLRQLGQWNSPLTRKGSAATCRPVRRHGDHLESMLDKVAQVRAVAGHRHPQSHR